MGTNIKRKTINQLHAACLRVCIILLAPYFSWEFVSRKTWRCKYITDRRLLAGWDASTGKQLLTIKYGK